MSEHSSGETHSQDRPSESCDLWPVLAHNLSRKHCLLPWQINKQLCVSVCLCMYSSRKCDCKSVFHQADTCLCICVNEHVHMCDRALQRGRLAAWVWTLHASFIPLTSDKAEALLVMMWLLLPIMPRCRLGRKTVRYILFVPHRVPMETNTLLLYYEAFSLCWDTLLTLVMGPYSQNCWWKDLSLSVALLLNDWFHSLSC